MRAEYVLTVGLLGVAVLAWLRSRLMDARGRVVIVTGCDSGIGLETCRLLAQSHGLCLVAACLTEAGRAALLRELAGAPARVVACVCDVTRPEDIIACVSLASSLGRGALHALINNAGVTGGSFVAWTPVDEYRRVMDVNFFGVVAMTKAALPLLLASRGRVICLSSVTAVEGAATLPTLSAYAASKHALEAFCRCLRAEYAGSGMRVSTINPGFTSTALISGTPLAAERLWSSLDGAHQCAWGAEHARAYFARARLAVQLVAWPPRAVARAVTHATLACWPRRRYWPSPDAALFFYPLTFAPDWLVDALLAATVNAFMPRRWHSPQRAVRAPD
ncbi:hypothetical protein KFE25_000529 [Diacronema lutheri]|uniref:Ketoreductase domain-containing protein n=1 Tax=Diacronema lutheri TaxID=2081491 RepID=A0A8J6CGZ7_DIALT|nr:hypothetical protein KFE25_000529 [Diacronema lutheri]